MQARRSYMTTATSALRGVATSALRGIGNGGATLAPAPIKVEASELEKIKAAGTVVQRIPFPVTCGLVRGTPVFFAQLKGGRRFGVTPVMPRDAMGMPVCPALNGEQGFLTLEMSENAQFEWVGPKLQVSIRPTLASWEPLPLATSEPPATKG